MTHHHYGSKTMLRRLSNMLTPASDAKRQTPTASAASTSSAQTPHQPAGLFSSVRTAINSVAGSMAPRAKLMPTDSFGKVAPEVVQNEILLKLDERSLVNFGAAAKPLQALSKPLMPEVFAREQATRESFVARAAQFDPTSPKVFADIGKWLAQTRDFPIDLSKPDALGALKTALNAALGGVKNKHAFKVAGKDDALAMLAQLHSALDRVAVTAQSGKPIGELLRIDLTIARKLRRSEGNLRQEANQLVTTMTSLALKHGKEAAATLMEHAANHRQNHNSPDLTALRFLGEALFQLRPVSSKATSLEQYAATEMVRAPRAGWFQSKEPTPAPTPQVETVKAVFQAAFQGVVGGSDRARDWFPNVLAAHNAPISGSPDMRELEAWAYRRTTISDVNDTL